VEGRGSAIAFFVILAILCATGYWVRQILQEGGDLIRFGPPPAASSAVALQLTTFPTVTPLAMAPSETPLFVPPTPAEATATPTTTPTATPQPPIALVTQPASAAGAIATVASPSAATRTPAGRQTVTVSPSPTALRTATPLTSATPTALPTATTPPTAAPPPPSPTAGWLFQVGMRGPNYERGCDGHYIYGMVYDANGAPLPGVRLHAFDIYGNDLGIAVSKDSPAGSYDFVISGVRDTWTVEVLGENGQRVSPQVEVVNTGSFQPGSEACWHQVDWVRR
jgi:hypothetical protein